MIVFNRSILVNTSVGSAAYSGNEVLARARASFSFIWVQLFGAGRSESTFPRDIRKEGETRARSTQRAGDKYLDEATGPQRTTGLVQ